MKGGILRWGREERALEPNLSGPDRSVHAYHPDILTRHPPERSQNMTGQRGRTLQAHSSTLVTITLRCENSVHSSVLISNSQKISVFLCKKKMLWKVLPPMKTQLWDLDGSQEGQSKALIFNSTNTVASSYHW